MGANGSSWVGMRWNENFPRQWKIILFFIFKLGIAIGGGLVQGWLGATPPPHPLPPPWVPAVDVTRAGAFETATEAFEVRVNGRTVHSKFDGMGFVDDAPGPVVRTPPWGVSESNKNFPLFVFPPQKDCYLADHPSLSPSYGGAA